MQINNLKRDDTIDPAYMARMTISSIANDSNAIALIQSIVGETVPESIISSPTAFEEWLHAKGWTLKDLSAIIVSGGAAITSPLTATRTVGGVSSGKYYETGTMIEQIIRDILNPVVGPTLTAPSATIIYNGNKLFEVGQQTTVTLTVSFNRGSISPAYGTSGYRSGTATSYKINNGSSQTSNVFTNIAVNETHKSFTATVNYNAGEQPKDSEGNNYSTPLAAGSVNSVPLEFEFVNALYADLDCDGTIEKLPLVSKEDKEFIFSFGPATEANPEIFEVPSTLGTIEILVYNIFTNRWEDCSHTFTGTTTTRQDAAGRDVTYTQYVCNLGYEMGAREIKIAWS